MNNFFDNKIIISQNCLSGHIYKKLNIQFLTPFIWSVIDYNSMLYLIKNWNNINWYNYELKKDINWNFSIIIDNNVKVQYVHYKFDEKSYNIIQKDNSIYYNKIWEYINEKYIERLHRMLLLNVKPLFIISNGKTIYQDCFYTNEQLKQLQHFDNVIIYDKLEKYDIINNADYIIKDLKNKYEKI